MLASVLVVVVVALAVVGLTLTVRRRGGDEVHSVEGYRSTLNTLETVRARSSAVRVLPPPGEAGNAPAGVGGEVDGGSGGPLAGPPAMTEAGSPAYRFADPELAPDPSTKWLRDTPRKRRRAMSAMNHGPRRVVAPIVAGIVVLGAVAALAYVGAHTHKTPPPSSSSSGSHSTTTVSHHGGSSAGSAHAHSTTTGHTRTTATTAPATYTPQPSTSNTASATYVPPAPMYALNVSTTTGACWVEVTNQPSGTVAFSQTLSPGSSQTINLRGTATMVLGAPGAATITLDGTPVAFPTGYGTPLTLTFAPPPAGA